MCEWLLKCSISAQEIQDGYPMLVQCWASVYDAGPTSNQHWITLLCL